MDNWHLSRGTAYLASGVGYGREKLSAFDAAELDVHIMAANAVKVSSFIPAGLPVDSRYPGAMRKSGDSEGANAEIGSAGSACGHWMGGVLF
jgi:pyruvoyl-dependent arginine decarboxylase (PvlArgDC)